MLSMNVEKGAQVLALKKNKQEIRNPRSEREYTKKQAGLCHRNPEELRNWRQALELLKTQMGMVENLH